MTDEHISDEQQMEQYLVVLRSHLRFLAPTEREEIVREIGAHLRDSAEGGGVSLRSAIERLGPAAALATQYRDNALIGRASRSFSPTLLLRATLRLAAKSFFGLLIFLFGVFGYAFGAGLVLTGMGKLLFPAHTGVWLQDGHFLNSGTMLLAPPAPAHEVMGWFYIPVAMALAGVVLAGTTVAIRLCLVQSRRWQERLQTGSGGESALVAGRA